jgi:hypothetical protein
MTETVTREDRIADSLVLHGMDETCRRFGCHRHTARRIAKERQLKPLSILSPVSPAEIEGQARLTSLPDRRETILTSAYGAMRKANREMRDGKARLWTMRTSKGTFDGRIVRAGTRNQIRWDKR